MSNVNLFNGCTFTVESNGEVIHTYDDWNLYITNTNVIGNPEQYTNYVTVPGRDGRLDMSEALTGRPIYIRRELTINLASSRPKTMWDATISYFRNHINGRVCRITFDNDVSYFWRGRVRIEDFESAMTLGQFTVKVEAEPYKYSILQSSDPWLWNPFNFTTDMITYTDAWDISGSKTVTVPKGTMPTTPTFVVSQLVGDSITMAVGEQSYTLVPGSNTFPEVKVNGDEDVEITFTGTAKVQIVYRGGSL